MHRQGGKGSKGRVGVSLCACMMGDGSIPGLPLSDL